MAENEKSALTSLGVWGGIIAILPSLLQGLGDIGLIPLDIVSPIIALIGAVLGGSVSIYGRVAATKTISKLW